MSLLLLINNYQILNTSVKLLENLENTNIQPNSRFYIL